MKKISHLNSLPLWWSTNNFIKYCALNVVVDPKTGRGHLPRKRRGQRFPGNPTARSAFWDFGDSLNKHPEYYWGTILLENKARLQQKHPEVVIIDSVTEDGKPYKERLYTPKWILQTARWQTASQFARWLFKQWLVIEARSGRAEAVTVQSPKPPPPAKLVEPAAPPKRRGRPPKNTPPAQEAGA